MSPQPRGVIPPDHQTQLRAAQEAAQAAQAGFRRAVVDALLAGASVREVAAFVDMSTNTIERWGREGGWPTAEQKAAREALLKKNREWRELMKRYPNGPPANL